jgi:hypothetical protein
MGHQINYFSRTRQLVSKVFFIRKAQGNVNQLYIKQGGYSVASEERENLSSTEGTPPTPEKKGFTNNQKLIAGIAGIALALCIGVIGDRLLTANSGQNQPVATSTTNSGDKQPAVPNEAKSFVAEYGSMYSDPVSTYYAEKAYEEAHSGKNLIMTADSIDKYNFIRLDFPTSTLGFTTKELPLDTKIDQNTSIEIFNSYTKPMLDLCLNYLAKNPSPEARKIVEHEVMNYCGGECLQGYNTWDKDQAVEIQKLLDTAEAIVAKHGSAANYSVALASTDDKNPDVTLFNKNIPTIVGYYEYNKEKIALAGDNGIRLVIDIETYNDKKVTKSQEVIWGVALSIERQPETLGSPTIGFYTGISIGQDI